MEIQIIKQKYPVTITPDFYMDTEGKKVAIINRFDENSDEYNLANSHWRDSAVYPLPEFFHVFYDENAAKVKKAIKDYLSSNRDPDEDLNSIFREEKDGSWYRCPFYADISPDIFERQEKLKSLVRTGSSERDILVIPLKMHLFPCPVCGARTLEDRWTWDICSECFWEDDMPDDDDNSIGANGPFTICAYREWYYKAKKEFPNQKGADIGRRIMESLPANCPEIIKKGDISLWVKHDIKKNG